MRRDLDLVRNILLHIEGKHEAASIQKLDFDAFNGFTQKVIYEHARLLREAGYLRDTKQVLGMSVMVSGLTWKGHDFLDSVRDPQVWAETKDAANKVGGWTVSLVSEIAKGLIKTKIKQHTGVEL